MCKCQSQKTDVMKYLYGKRLKTRLLQIRVYSVFSRKKNVDFRRNERQRIYNGATLILNKNCVTQNVIVPSFVQISILDLNFHFIFCTYDLLCILYTIQNNYSLSNR